MIPATPAKIIPNIISLIKGINTKKARIAPIGSDNPDKKDNLNAFFLLPVAK